MRLVRTEFAMFRRRLLVWFARHRRELPWRQTRDPYRIWLSEVMLQQTRVAAVLPYYQRFVRRFPTLRALAHAPIEEVVRQWAGLGYYNRARNLHRAAREIVTQHGGRFPRDLREALALPGIGPYTAPAILSIAYGAPLAVLDGNVARVLARLDVVRGDPRASANWKKLQGRAQKLFARETPGDWNQAMMELGATVCTPRAPRCKICPVSRWCRGYQLGIAEELPARRRRRRKVRLRIAAAILLDRGGRTLLVRARGELAVLFSGMWQFPAVKVGRKPRGELQRHVTRSLGLRESELIALPAARHTVTFREISLEPFLVRVPRLPRVAGARALPLAQISRVPVSNATRKIAAAAWSNCSKQTGGGRPRKADK